MDAKPVYLYKLGMHPISFDQVIVKYIVVRETPKYAWVSVRIGDGSEPLSAAERMEFRIKKASIGSTYHESVDDLIDYHFNAWNMAEDKARRVIDEAERNRTELIKLGKEWHQNNG